MIAACLTDEDDIWLGDWCFEALPRIGEHIMLPADRFEVIGIEHWPVMREHREKAADYQGIRVRVRLLSSPA